MKFHDDMKQVIDSCIAVTINRPLIQANHLVQKIPLYFDETPRSKPDLSLACDSTSDDESEVSRHTPVAYAPHLRCRTTVIPYARCQC